MEEIRLRVESFPAEAIAEGINREFAKYVLDASKLQILNRIQEIVAAWEKAAKEEIQLAHGHAEGAEKHVSLSEAFPKTAAEVLAQEAARIQAAGGKDGLPHGSDLDARIAQTLIRGMRPRYADQAKEIAREVTEVVEDLLGRSQGKEGPNWNCVLTGIAGVGGCDRIIAELVSKLREDFPLTLVKQKQTKNAKALDALLVKPLPGNPVFSRVSNSGEVELRIPDTKTRVYYNRELGAEVLEPVGGLLSIPGAPLVVEHHGAGTVKSVAASWNTTMNVMLARGFNPVAPGLPMAGVGMPIRAKEEEDGFWRTTAYVDHQLRWFRKQLPDHLPLADLGRSMGASYALAHAMTYGDQPHAPEFYWLMSFSNFFTIGPQKENVLDQMARGEIKGVIEASLDNAVDYNSGAAGQLDARMKQDPALFKLRFGNVLFLQGNDDEDGGRTVVKDQVKFWKTYVPSAHFFLFKNRLKKYRELSDLHPDVQEGKHFLITARANLSREDLIEDLEQRYQRAVGKLTPEESGEKLSAMRAKKERQVAALRALPDADLPALQAQTTQLLGVLWGHMDYMAETVSPFPHMQRARERVLMLREKLGGVRFLDAFVASLGISPEEWQAARPGGRSTVELLAEVRGFWSEEARREARELRAHGLIP